MTMANTLNYSSPGGDEWVVGGRLVIRKGAVVMQLHALYFLNVMNLVAAGPLTYWLKPIRL